MIFVVNYLALYWFAFGISVNFELLVVSYRMYREIKSIEWFSNHIILNLNTISGTKVNSSRWTKHLLPFGVFFFSSKEPKCHFYHTHAWFSKEWYCMETKPVFRCSMCVWVCIGVITHCSLPFTRPNVCSTSQHKHKNTNKTQSWNSDIEISVETW